LLLSELKSLCINPGEKPATILASGERIDSSMYPAVAVTVEPSVNVTVDPANPAQDGPMPTVPSVE
jgi:hypothetical protein